MYPTSTLCRAQEAFHRDRACDARLENVRTIATNAAVAWGREAIMAERREARRRRVQIVADLAAVLDRRDHEDRLLSENPDRGFENS